MEEKFNQFLRYDFRNSPEWKAYYDNIFPSPPVNRLEHYKRKFYKLKIDNDFDVNYDPSRPNYNPNNPNNQNQNSNSNSNPNNNNNSQFNNNRQNNSNYNNNFNRNASNNRNNNNNQSNNNNSQFNIDNKFLCYLELGLIIGVLYSIVFVSIEVSLIISFIYFAYRTLYKIGLPRIDQEYIELILKEENFHSLILTLILIVLSEYKFIITIPNLVHMVLQTSLNFQNTFPNLSRNKYLLLIKGKKNEIMLTKTLHEVLDILPLIGGLFLNMNGFFIIIVYIQFIKFKFYSSTYSKRIFEQTNNYIERMKSNHTTPKPIKMILQFLQGGAKFILNSTNNVQFQGGSFAVCAIY